MDGITKSLYDQPNIAVISNIDKWIILKTVEVVNKPQTEKKEIVLLIELLSNKIDINTISGMARSKNKTPRGIRTSNKYKKIKIGDALLCVDGLNDNKLPF